MRCINLIKKGSNDRVVHGPLYLSAYRSWVCGPEAESGIKMVDTDEEV